MPTAKTAKKTAGSGDAAAAEKAEEKSAAGEKKPAKKASAKSESKPAAKSPAAKKTASAAKKTDRTGKTEGVERQTVFLFEQRLFSTTFPEGI